MSQCSGCGNWTHQGCVEQLDIGTSWHAEMCLTCKHKATRWLRVVSAVESTQWYRWNEEDWFRAFLNQLQEGSRLGISLNQDLNALEIFMATAIEAGMNYWEYPREVTPTEGPASPRPAEPPGLPTPRGRTCSSSRNCATRSSIEFEASCGTNGILSNAFWTGNSTECWSRSTATT